MKRIALALIALLAITVGCSEDNVSSNSPQLQIQTEIDGVSLTGSAMKDIAVQAGENVDSVHITKVRVLLSQIKLQTTKDDSVNGGRTVKAGPAVLTFDSSGTKTFMQTDIPEGSYRRMKLEFHKFSGSEADQHKNTPEFADFITPDRVTAIVDGFKYKDGVRTAFSFRSDKTANVTMWFFPPFDTKNGATSRVVIRVQPSGFLKKAAKILDPADNVNKSDIIEAFEKAITAILR